jgi:hypothetical protein
MDTELDGLAGMGFDLVLIAKRFWGLPSAVNRRVAQSASGPRVAVGTVGPVLGGWRLGSIAKCDHSARPKNDRTPSCRS